MTQEPVDSEAWDFRGVIAAGHEFVAIAKEVRIEPPCAHYAVDPVESFGRFTFRCRECGETVERGA